MCAFFYASNQIASSGTGVSGCLQLIRDKGEIWDAKEHPRSVVNDS